MILTWTQMMAALSANTYVKGRSPENLAPLPPGATNLPDDLGYTTGPAGFEASAYDVAIGSSSKIVIAYTGTLPGPVDFLADGVIGLGNVHSQVLEAAAFYKRVQAANPGREIVFTGHSLGGGLAALMAVFFNRPAYTFNSAPFRLAATRETAGLVDLYLRGAGFGIDSALTSFSTDEVPLPIGAPSAIPILLGAGLINLGLAAILATRPFPTRIRGEENIQSFATAGEVLSVGKPELASLLAPLLDRLRIDDPIIGVQFVQNGGAAANIDPSSLHSMPLLTIFELEPRLAQDSVQLARLLPLLFDKALYAKDIKDGDADILIQLLTQQFKTGAKQVLANFATDLDKLVGNTGLIRTQDPVRDALIVAAQEYYYFKDATAANGLFNLAGGGIHFKFSDISSAATFKSRTMLENAIGALLPSEEQFLRSKLLEMDSWHLQEGSAPLIWTGDPGDVKDAAIGFTGSDVLDGGGGEDVLFGGDGNDTLKGGGDGDYLIGGAGDDTLEGDAGSFDYLYGGAGNDTYVFNTGDGDDVIEDSGHDGQLKFGTSTVLLGANISKNRWESADHALTIFRQDDKTLILWDSNQTFHITVRNWTNGDFGITLPAISNDPAPTGTDIYPGAVPPFIASQSLGDLDNIHSNSSSWRIHGLDGNDALISRTADDELIGGNGSDLLIGGSGHDVISGGDNRDFIISDWQNNLAAGTAYGSPSQPFTNPAGINVLFSGLGWGIGYAAGQQFPITDPRQAPLVESGVAFSAGVYNPGTSDTVDAGAGDDYVNLGDGADVASGGSGDDVIFGEGGDDSIDGGDDSDSLFGDGQGDTIALANWQYSTEADGKDVLSGGGGNDFLYGQGNDDRLFGEAGDDVIYGDDNHDEAAYLTMGTPISVHGKDFIDGGTGDDQIEGGGSDDIILGGAGHDTINGDGVSVPGAAQGKDIIYGGDDADTLFGSGGDDVLDGGTGNDIMFGDQDASVLDVAFHGKDRLDGGDGDDTMVGGGGDDFLFGRAGADTMYGDQASPGLPDAANGADWLLGGDGIDTIFGGGGNDFISGDDGDDILHGDDITTRVAGAAQGNDTIDAGAGTDTVFGWGGNDTILGGDGNDTLSGDAPVGDLAAQFHGDDHLEGEDGDDTLIGNGGNDVLFGGDGTDALDGDAGAAGTVAGDDYLDGGAGNDTLAGRGGADQLYGQIGNDGLDGGDGNDQLYGGEGSDTLIGGAGNDLLQGGQGTDILQGGSGDDTYVFDKYDLLVINGTADAILDIEGNNRVVFRDHFTESDLVLFSGALAGTVTIERQDGDDVGLIIDSALGGAVREFEFSDGTLVSGSTLIGHHLIGLANQSSTADGSYLLGGVLGDTISATGENATLSGGYGDDLLTGGTGSTTYLFDRGDGTDTVNDTSTFASSGGTRINSVNFGAGITAADVSLVLTPGSTTPTLTVAGGGGGLRLGAFSATDVVSGPRTIDELHFANGSSLTWNDFIAANGVSIINTTGATTYSGTNVADHITGGANDETIDGGTGNDVIDGGAGNDTLSGGAGSDTYRFLRGGGRDTINNDDSAPGAVDRLEFGSDIAPANVQFIHLGDDLIATIFGTADRVTIRNYFTSAPLDEIRFANGTTYTPGTVPAITSNLTATAGADLLVGTTGNDSIDALGGNDEVYGSAGNDTLAGGAGVDVVSGGDGVDTITDADGASNTLLGDAGDDTITGDGTLDGGSGNDILTGGSFTSTRLFGGDGNDTLAPGTGSSQVLDGGAGSDTYVGFTGSLTQFVTINQFDTSAGKLDTVRFDANVSGATTRFNQFGDLILVYGNNSQLIVKGALLDDTNERKIDQFVFQSTSTTWTSAFIESQLAPASAADNFYRGTSGTDTYNGLGGNDVIYGGGGADTLTGGGTNFDGTDYLFGGDGNDTLIGTGTDLFHHAELHGGAGDDTLTNGSASFGDDGNDQISGGGLLDGGAGNDVLTGVQGASNDYKGGAGSDTFVIDRGGTTTQYNDNIVGLDTDPGSIDVIRLAAGVTPDQVRFVRSADSLSIQVLGQWGGIERTIQLDDYFVGDTATSQVDEIRFTDDPSLVWREADIRAMVAQGTARDDTLNGSADADTFHGGDGNDTITGQNGADVLYGDAGNDSVNGNSGDDVLVGGAGNDWLQGSQGDDTYFTGRNQGFDTITEADEPGADNVIYFDADVLDGDITFYRVSDAGSDDPTYLISGNDNSVDDLIIKISGSSGYTRVQDFFGVDPGWVINTFVLGDGSRYSSSYVDSHLINLAGTANFQTGTAGNDTFIIDHTLDGIDEEEPDGIDTAVSSVSYELMHNGGVENLTLTGSFNLNGTGNELNNVITANSGNNVLSGGAANFGFSAGVDTLIGGAGDDTYFVDQPGGTNYSGWANTDDTVIEQAGEGYDTVTFNGYSLTLAANVERLVLKNFIAGAFNAGTVPVGTDSRPRLSGNSLDNVIDAAASPNAASWGLLVLDGGTGADRMIGGADGQTFVIDNPGDTIEFRGPGKPLGNVESSISYTAPSFIRKVTLLGTAAISATGSAANDTLDGSKNTAANTLTGGAGDDIYIVDALDQIVEATGQGTDSVQASVSVTLAANVENLTLTGTSAINGTGNGLANQLTGNSAANTLDGAAGADVMTGGGGNDIYFVDDSSDSVVEGSSAGTDEVRSTIDYTLGTNLENLTLLGSASINGTGNSVANIIQGNSGNNTLDGGGGADTLRGGTGNDIFIVDNASDSVVENTGEGTDEVRSSITYTLGTSSEIESFLLTGSGNINATGNNGNNIITGNSGNNQLNGGGGSDTLIGGAGTDSLRGNAGDDIYIIDESIDTVVENASEGTDEIRASFTYTLASLTNVEKLTLTGSANINGTGNTANNTITGNSGDNTLDPGTAGTDTLIGGAGNDTYMVGRTGITIQENAGEGTADTVISSVAYTLGNEVENLTLTAAVTGTGNGLDNVLTGNSGNNTLTGLGGNDTLDPGSAGTDSLVGGAGNDTYIVNRSSGVSITETSGNGVDTISTNLTTVLSSTTDIELLFLTGTTAINGTGNTLNNLIRGNAMNNTLAGGTGVDILEGGALNDTLSDSGGITLFNGGSGTDTITSGATNDLLIGGTGNDALTTGSGADLIVFNKGDGADTVAASTTKDNTVSIGGGALYADLLFQKSGNDLILKVGTSDQITFTGYYTSTSNRSVNKLQIVIEGTTDYDAASSDTTRNEKIETFNFDGLVAAFDAALIATPSLTTWALTNALAAQYLSGSDTAALGGDLAYRYNRFGTLSDISFTPAIGILNGSGFGTTAQNLQSLTSLQDASARLS